MAANVQNTPGKTDWAEDSEPDLATSVPPPQVTKNKDGTETVSTVEANIMASCKLEMLRRKMRKGSIRPSAHIQLGIHYVLRNDPNYIC